MPFRHLEVVRNGALFGGPPKAPAASAIKVSSTAFVRAIRRGGLSPAAIQRGASAMAPGKFRFVSNLGRGEFSLADKVVGNVGGAPGLAVRKMPTRQISPVEQYAPHARATSYLNDRFSPGGTPPIAPIRAVTPQGAFQALGTGQVELPLKLPPLLRDLHRGNIGPGGQIIDFQLPSRLDMEPALRQHMWKNPFAAGEPRMAPVIDPRARTNTWRDYFANLNLNNPQDRLDAAGRAMSDNRVRRYWSLPEGRRQTYQSGLEAAHRAETGQKLRLTAPNYPGATAEPPAWRQNQRRPALRSVAPESSGFSDWASLGGAGLAAVGAPGYLIHRSLQAGSPESAAGADTTSPLPTYDQPDPLPLSPKPATAPQGEALSLKASADSGTSGLRALRRLATARIQRQD